MNMLLPLGTRFGKVIVLGTAKTTTNGNFRMSVKCDCGHEFVVRRAWLKNGRVTACLKCSKERQ